MGVQDVDEVGGRAGYPREVGQAVVGAVCDARDAELRVDDTAGLNLGEERAVGNLCDAGRWLAVCGPRPSHQPAEEDRCEYQGCKILGLDCRKLA